MTYQNDLIIRAAKGEKVERTPVWLMRQAGRILKEYRDVRAKLSGFKELVETPERAAEVTIQPVDLLGVDAAIIFSDILVVPEAMGLPYEMIEKQGPNFPRTIQSQKDVDRLIIPNPYEGLAYTLEAIKITKKELNGRVPIIGFAGAPWTIFSYMIEGKGSKTFSQAKKMLYTNPLLSHQLMEKITQTTIQYLKAQVECGAEIVQVFDSWAGILSEQQYQEFAIPYIAKICDSITNVPVTVFSKGAYFARKDLAKLNCRTIGLDWNMDPLYSRAIIGPNKTLQGNLDPCVLYADFKTIERKTNEMLDKFKGGPHIANLGHGVYPDIHPDAVRCFIDTVKAY